MRFAAWTARLGICALALPLLAGAGAAQEGGARFPFSFIPSAKIAPPEDEPSGVRFRVLGGNIAAAGAWPWQVALIRSGADDVWQAQYCGGTLITRRWVLTAAHCVFEAGPDGSTGPVRAEEVGVLVGTNILRAGSGETIPAAVIHVHPAYDPVRIDNDIALIRLAYAPEVAVATIQLPTADAETILIGDGVDAVVTGWGRMEDGRFPVDLREAHIQVLSRRACNEAVIGARAETARAAFTEAQRALGVDAAAAEEAWRLMLSRTPGPITDNMVCSGSLGGGRGSCNGDSGGPLLIRMPNETYVQVGIVSWGFTSETDTESCSLSARFSAYTRVSVYADWIRTTVEGGAR